MFDKTKTTSLEDFDSQLDYMIKVGIFNRVKDVKTIHDIETDWFKSLSRKEKTKELNNATDDWWKQYGEEQMNELYTDTLIQTDDFKTDITNFWIQFLRKEDKLQKYMGIQEYKDNIKRHKAKLKKMGTHKKNKINEVDSTLQIYLKENNKKLTNNEIETLSKQLHRRRLSGGCSLWRNIGIEYLYKTNKEELYDFEIEWYEKNFGSNNE
jgi:hypothetical protein